MALCGPDGRRLAFVSTLREDNRQMFVVDADSPGLRRLTRNSKAPDGTPATARQLDDLQNLVALVEDCSLRRRSRTSPSPAGHPNSLRWLTCAQPPGLPGTRDRPASPPAVAAVTSALSNLHALGGVISGNSHI
jgi:hypothetical protein